MKNIKIHEPVFIFLAVCFIIEAVITCMGKLGPISAFGIVSEVLNAILLVGMAIEPDTTEVPSVASKFIPYKKIKKMAGKAVFVVFINENVETAPVWGVLTTTLVHTVTAENIMADYSLNDYGKIWVGYTAETKQED